MRNKNGEVEREVIHSQPKSAVKNKGEII